MLANFSYIVPFSQKPSKRIKYGPILHPFYTYVYFTTSTFFTKRSSFTITSLE